jgi:hypothetical protein
MLDSGYRDQDPGYKIQDAGFRIRAEHPPKVYAVNEAQRCTLKAQSV